MGKPKITYRQEDGGDGFCYVLRVDGRALLSGLSQSEARYEKRKMLDAWEQRHPALTEEQMKHFGPMLQRTYEALAADAKCHNVSEIVEMTCDANRPEMYGGMSRAEYDQLSASYIRPDTQRWLRKVLNY